MRRKWSAVSWSALRTGKKELWALADSCLTFKKPLSAMIYYSIRPSSSHSLGSRNSSYPALCSHHVTHCHTFAHCLCPSVHEALLPGTGLGPAMAAAQRAPPPHCLGPHCACGAVFDQMHGQRKVGVGPRWWSETCSSGWGMAGQQTGGDC